MPRTKAINTCLLFFALIISHQVWSQDIVSGKIISADDGEALPGVTIAIKGTTTGTVSDADGRYQLIAAPDDVLVVRFIGFEMQEIPVSNRSVIDIEMQVEVGALEEIVVVGYGEVKKKDLTGSVSIVKGKDITRTASASLDQALQGQAAGVQVTQVSGRPGGQTSIRIRGSSSVNAGNEPLFVIDGMLVSSNNDDINAGGTAGSSVNPLSAINPSDIESIQVLKDASATALYGSRGANGVVIITTKRGQAGRASISLDSYYGFQSVPAMFDLLNGEEFANYINDINRERGLPSDVRYIIPENFGEGTDWQEAIFRDAPMQSHQLTIAGGDENTRYSIGGGYFQQDGIVLNSDFERATFRASLDRTVNERLKIGSNVNLSHITSRGVLTGALGPGTGVLLPGSITSAVLFPPTLPVLDENGPGGYTFDDDRGRNLPNPVADALETDNINNNSRLIGSLFTEWEVIDDLVFKINLGIDGFSTKDNRFVPNFLKRTEPNNGEAVVSTVDGFTWLTEYTLTYDKEINEDHSINALVGYTRQAFQSERLFSTTLDFPDNTYGWHNIRSGINPQPSATGENNWGIVSYLGRANYNYRGKYLITATGRLDGSSRFGRDSKWGFFPSLAFGWNIAEEDFFDQNDFFQSFKLRTSVGVIGNSEIGSFNSLATVGPNGEGTFTNDEVYLGLAPLRRPNPDLRWERTTQFNIGFDIAFFDTRVMVTTDYYNQRTTDLLLFRPIPNTSGFSNFFDNIGELKNEGIELAIDAIIIDKNPFTWRANFNISSNRNEILKLSDDNDIFAPGVLQVPAGWNIIRVGEPLGTFYGLINDGIFQSDDEAQSSAVLVGQTPEAGQRKYRDINGRDEQGNLTGEPDGIINEADRAILGQAQPKFTWNITNNFEYKGIDFSFFIQASHGNSMVNAYQFELGTLTGETNVYRDAYFNRWTPENPSNEYPKLDPTDRGVFSSAQVEDASFIRLRNVSLGYSLPSKILDKLSLSNMRIYCTATNLFTLTDYSGYDPEVNAFGQNALLLGIDYGGYPLARSFIAGIQIGL